MPKTFCPAALYSLTLRLLVAVSAIYESAWRTKQQDSFLKYIGIRKDTTLTLR